MCRSSNSRTCPNTITSNRIPKALYSVRSSTPFTVLYFAYLTRHSQFTGCSQSLVESSV